MFRRKPCGECCSGKLILDLGFFLSDFERDAMCELCRQNLFAVQTTTLPLSSNTLFSQLSHCGGYTALAQMQQSRCGNVLLVFFFHLLILLFPYQLGFRLYSIMGPHQ
jgi:hypothetical protein